MDNFESTVDLTPQPPAQGGITLPPDTGPKVSSGVLASRADKANLGLSNVMKKSKEDISNAIALNEDGFRQEAASTLDYNKALQKQNIVSQILKTGGQVDPKTLADFMSPGPSTDPKSVIEENYGRQFVSPILNMSNDFMKNSFMSQAMQEIPKQVNDAFNAGADLAAKGEFARTKRDNIAAIIQNQSWPMWAAQEAFAGIPGVTEAATYRFPQSWSEVLKGENLEEQRKERWNQPFDKFKEDLTSRLDALTKVSPQIALDYANAMVGQSTEDQTLNNQQSLLNLTVVGGTARKLLKETPGLEKKVQLLGDVQSAVKDVVKSTEVVKDGPLYEMSPEEYSWENEGGAIRKDVEIVQADSRGDVKEAAIKQAAQNTLKTITHTVDPTSQTIQALPTVYKKDQRGIKTNPGNYGQEIVNRQAEQTAAHIEEISNVVANTAKVNRVPELLASEDAQRALFEKTKNDHPELSGHVMNLTGPHWNTASNTFENHIILGKHTGEFFRSFSEAKNWARINRIPLETWEQTYTEKTFRKVGKKTVPGPTRVLAEPDEKLIPGARIRSKGFGFYIEKPVPVDLRDDIVRNTFGTTEFSKQQHSLFPSIVDDLVGWLRTPDERATMDDRINRKIATNAPGNFMELARATIQDIAKIAPASQTDLTRPKAQKRWDEWAQIVKSTQDKIDPATGEKGYDFKNPGEVENEYLTVHNRLPDKAEIAAYFAFKRINADDYNYRSLSLLRNKHNVGAQSHRFEVTGPDGKQVKSPWIDGVRLNELPGGRDTIAIFKRDIDHTKLMPANMMGKARDEIAEEVKTGKSRVIEIYDPDSTPLKGFGGLTEENQVRYIVFRNAEERPLNILDQLPRRGGGHIENDYPFYLKQADMVQDPTTKRHRYRGDKTALALPNRAMGEEFAKKLNDLHPLIKAERYDEAKALYESYFETGNIPADWEDHLKNYKAEKGQRPRWNTDEPFVVIPADKTIADMPLHLKDLEERYNGPDKDNIMFEDGSRHGSLAKQNTIQFTGQRDAYELMEVQDVGKRHNPVYKYAPAKTIDSVPMQMRALARIVNDFAGMNDQKMYAIEHWLFGDADGKGNGAEHYIKTDNKNDIRYSPFYYYNNYEYRSGTPKGSSAWMTLEQQHYNSKMFAGTPSIIDNWLTSTAQTLADSIYTKGGPKASKLDPTWMLPMLSDGPRFTRSMFFNAKFFLNPAMFSVHFSTLMNTSAIAGARPAMAGSFASILHGFTAVNKSPGIMKYLDGLASKAGFGGWNFKPGQFMEAYEGMMRYGANRLDVAQLSDLDNPVSSKILVNGTSHLLDAGLIPFKAGIKPVKIASWYVAYLERRNGGGGKFNWQPTTGRLTESDWGQILERQDILSHSMTRASTSIPQKTLAGLPMQFSGYHLRVAELLTGKRLTQMEKVRLIGTSLAMYGVKATAGVVGLSTLAEYYINKTKDIDYIPGNDFMETAIMDGLLAAGVGKLTGSGNIRKGNIYNFGQRWGLGDWDTMNSLLDGDPKVWDIWGAAPNGIANTIAATSPIRNWALSMWKGDGKFQLTPEHWIGLLKEISVVKDLDRAYWGMTAHQWLSRNGRTIASDISTMNTLGMLLAGLQEQRFADTFKVGEAIRHLKDQENKAFDMAQKEMSLGFRDNKNNDDDNAHKHFLNAKAYLEGYPANKYNEAYAKALKDNKDLIDTLAMERYMGKMLPIEQREKAMNTMSQIRQMQKEREGR